MLDYKIECLPNNFMKKGKRRIAGVIILAGIICYAFVSLICSKYGLKTTNYKISTSEITSSLRIVQLTDLHNSEFGADNHRLIERVQEQEPDLILMTGDMLNASEENTEIVEALIRALSGIAPVYYSYGNHEKEYEEKYQISLVPLLEAAGAVVLEREYEDVMIGHQVIRLGGIYGYCVPAKFLETNEADPQECAFLKEFMDTDEYTLLLCHMPYTWNVLNGLEEWGIDCVMCGHIHGGQVYIPFAGGVYAPDEGWFPGKEKGCRVSEDGQRYMILSAGLGSAEGVPRFNNPPELVVLDLLPES